MSRDRAGAETVNAQIWLMDPKIAMLDVSTAVSEAYRAYQSEADAYETDEAVMASIKSNALAGDSSHAAADRKTAVVRSRHKRSVVLRSAEPTLDVHES